MDELKNHFPSLTPKNSDSRKALSLKKCIRIATSLFRLIAKQIIPALKLLHRFGPIHPDLITVPEQNPDTLLLMPYEPPMHSQVSGIFYRSSVRS